MCDNQDTAVYDVVDVNYVAAMQNHTYEVSGRILAYSVVHRGPVPCFLSETLYTAITRGNEAAFQRC